MSFQVAATLILVQTALGLIWWSVSVTGVVAGIAGESVSVLTCFLIASFVYARLHSARSRDEEEGSETVDR